MAEPDIQLGDIARDTVTGYQGTVIARTEWLNGCWRLTLQSNTLDKEGKPSAHTKPTNALGVRGPNLGRQESS